MLSSVLPFFGVVLASSTLHSFDDGIPVVPSLKGRQSSGTWTLVRNGTTGVAAMQLGIVSPTLAIIIDKVESNPMQIDGHSAWGALYSLVTNTAKPLNVISNTFCAGGTFISNGTLVSVGGNGVIDPDWGDQDGMQGIRLFGPCDDPSGDTCDSIYEDPDNLHLAESRWYPSSLRIFDGSAIIIGGTSAGGFENNIPGTNIASYEFFPKKNDGVPVPSSFLDRTTTANLFPIALALPDGTIFIAANTQSIIYNVTGNTETALPNFPNGVRVTYPFSGSGTLLPLTPPNYTPEVLICGGSTVSDTIDPSLISSQTPASNQCVRMVLTPQGIAAGWKVEHMLEARMMPETVLLPNGQILIVNGCKTGVAGYGNVANQVGQSNCDNPAFKPSLYTPSAAAGSRFSNTGMPTSSIARLYHSVATLTPMGNIMIAGSNPNADVSTTKYATEYRVEWLNPPYMTQARPSMTNPPSIIGFNQVVTISVSIPAALAVSSATVQVSLMDLGFITHATHDQGRLVFLVASLSSDFLSMTITGPPNGMIYPPGPGYIFLTINGVTSVGAKVMIGSGGNPPVPSI